MLASGFVEILSSSEGHLFSHDLLSDDDQLALIAVAFLVRAVGLVSLQRRLDAVVAAAGAARVASLDRTRLVSVAAAAAIVAVVVVSFTHSLLRTEHR